VDIEHVIDIQEPLPLPLEPPDELIELLVRFWRVLHDISAPTRHGELTAQQFWLLRQLRRRGPSRVGELAVALGIAQSSVTAASQRLAAAGLISRLRDDFDERVVLLTLSPAGAERVDEWRAQRRETLNALLASLDPSQQRQLQALLERLLAHVGEAAL
jgi:DNA-binding MarR family transcriptional regulator